MSNRFAFGVLIVVVVGLAVFVAAADRRTKPTETTAAPQPLASPPAVPVNPGMTIPAVIDVLDIDPLLDPPVIPQADAAPPGVVMISFEDEVAPAAVPTTPAPPIIPPAID